MGGEGWGRGGEKERKMCVGEMVDKRKETI